MSAWTGEHLDRRPLLLSGGQRRGSRSPERWLFELDVIVLRRTGVRTRRHHPGSGARPADRPAGPTQAVLPVHLARPRCHPPHGRPGSGDASWAVSSSQPGCSHFRQSAGDPYTRELLASLPDWRVRIRCRRFTGDPPDRAQCVRHELRRPYRRRNMAASGVAGGALRRTSTTGWTWPRCSSVVCSTDCSSPMYSASTTSTGWSGGRAASVPQVPGERPTARGAGNGHRYQESRLRHHRSHIVRTSVFIRPEDVDPGSPHQGQVGWNIVTGYLESAARNHGLDTITLHADRYDIADEYTEVLYKLWEGSWRTTPSASHRIGPPTRTSAKVHPDRP